MTDSSPPWAPRRCGEATSLAGCASVGAVAVVCLPRLNGKEVLFIGSSDATVHTLERAGHEKVMTRKVIPKRVEHERIQCLSAFVRENTPAEDDCCAVLVAYFCVTSQIFSLVLSNVWFRSDGSLQVAAQCAIKTFTDTMLLRLFCNSACFSVPNKVLVSAVVIRDENRAHDKQLASEHTALIVDVPSYDAAERELHVTPWKSEAECGFSAAMSSILSLAAGSITCIASEGGTLAAGCVNGEVIVSIGTRARVLKRLSGPVSDLRLFSPKPFPDKSSRSPFLNSFLPESMTSEKIGRLIALDTTGTVLLASKLDEAVVQLELLEDVAQFAPNITPFCGSTEVGQSITGDSAPATNVPIEAEKDSAFGRVKAAILGKKKPNHHNQLSRGPPGAEISEPQLTESTHCQTVCKITEQTSSVGNVLSRGPTSLCISDFNGDGFNEIIVSTMGRALVYCNFDESNSKYQICGTQTAPTQMFFMHLLKSECPEKEDLLVLCGPRHVLATSTNFSSLALDKIRIISRILQRTSNGQRPDCET